MASETRICEFPTALPGTPEEPTKIPKRCRATALQSRQEVFETLDRQYREQHKPRVWFLPLSEPIAPHLDELVGPLPSEPK